MNGAPASFASRLAISVLPTPVGPIISMFLGRTSSRNPPSSCCRRQRLRSAMETARLASAWPTMKRSSSETISRGEKSVMGLKVGWKTEQASGLNVRGCERRSCAADHQERGPVRRLDDAVLLEARLLIGADGASVGGIRIDHHARGALRQQPLGKAANERGAVAAVQHLCIADELVQAARAGRLRTEAGIPVAQIVALQICKLPAARG